MLDERILSTIEKIGQEIKNANELNIDLINTLAENILEWQEYKEETGEFNLLDCEEVFENSNWMNDKNKISFKLKDGSTWRYVSYAYNCILHSFNDVPKAVFQCADNENLFKCSDTECNKFLKQSDDIVREYYPSNNNNLLFPIEWTDSRIEAWCKKRENKQQDYEDEREKRYELRRMELLANADCSTCCHMKHSCCELGNNEDEAFEDICEDYEER
jgi:hypothetical protein